MEWATALDALGGGASAILTLGAIYLFWIERGAKETYLQMLMDRKDEAFDHRNGAKSLSKYHLRRSLKL